MAWISLRLRTSVRVCSSFTRLFCKVLDLWHPSQVEVEVGVHSGIMGGYFVGSGLVVWRLGCMWEAGSNCFHLCTSSLCPSSLHRSHVRGIIWFLQVHDCRCVYLTYPHVDRALWLIWEWKPFCLLSPFYLRRASFSPCLSHQVLVVWRFERVDYACAFQT